MLNFEEIPKQHKYTINNVPLYFPYPLYELQKNLIQSIIQGLQSNQNGLFHSPTGTGKTLCFLVAVLAYMEHNPNENIQFIFCTRTHSQMKGIVKELKKTCYAPPISMLGSRNILCLNEHLRDFDGEIKSMKCSEIKKDCKFFENFNMKIDDIENLLPENKKKIRF